MGMDVGDELEDVVDELFFDPDDTRHDSRFELVQVDTVIVLRILVQHYVHHVLRLPVFKPTLTRHYHRH